MRSPSPRISILLSISLMFAVISQAAQPTHTRRDWEADFGQMLQNKVLKFWLDHAVDQKFGGVLGRLDRKGAPTQPDNKSLVLESRTLWAFAEAYRRYPNPAYKDVALSCQRFLRDHFFDKEHGGYYFMVSRDGHPTDTTKLINPMCYTMEGLAEAAMAFHDPSAAQEALDLFRVIDKAAHDETYGGYRMVFTADWKYIEDYKPGYEGPPPTYTGTFDRKSFDWHLGALEAFATLYDVTGDSLVRRRLEELLDIFNNKIVDVNQGYGRLFFTRDWKQYFPDERAHESEYGLDCEASWLIMESARLVGRVNDPKTRQVVLALADHALRVGFDQEHGGLYNSGPVAGAVTNKGKSWWQECEALVAFLNAFQMTGDAKYWDAFDKQAKFVEDKFLDHEYGEWYTGISADGKIESEKIGPWKAPYHITRALLEVTSRLGRTL